MQACLLLRGIVTALNTPFTAADELDAGALRRHVRVALTAGVAGFRSPAMASEVEKLTAAKRRLFVDPVPNERLKPSAISSPWVCHLGCCLRGWLR